MEIRTVKDDDGYTYELQDSKIVAVGYGYTNSHIIRVGDVVHMHYGLKYEDGVVEAIHYNMETAWVSDNIIDVLWPTYDGPVGSKIWEVETEDQRLERKALERYSAARHVFCDFTEQICLLVKAKKTAEIAEPLALLTQRLIDIAKGL
jgi:hypothetical protein